MAQKEITENGVTKLIIYTSINCKEYSGGKIQRKKVVQGIAKGSQKANAIERELIRVPDATCRVDTAQHRVHGLGQGVDRARGPSPERHGLRARHVQFCGNGLGGVVRQVCVV